MDKNKSEITTSLQPNSRHCFVCGLESPVGLKMRFTDDGVDQVRSIYTVDDKFQGYPGIVHGGVVAAMLDEAAGRVVLINDPDRFFMTAKMEIRYRQPVPTETELVIVGWMVRDRRRLVEAHGEIQLPDGSIAAEATVMLVDIPPEYVGEVDHEELGWKVYD
ncbi:MAG: PaaI family thioesterase [Anaerolineae bacterium]|nr:PaaI family thioesterase [Anaerolineae bacterium]